MKQIQAAARSVSPELTSSSKCLVYLAAASAVTATVAAAAPRVTDTLPAYRLTGQRERQVDRNEQQPERITAYTWSINCLSSHFIRRHPQVMLQTCPATTTKSSPQSEKRVREKRKGNETEAEEMDTDNCQFIMFPGYPFPLGEGDFPSAAAAKRKTE